MAIFREYLADWEFGERWRPFVVRLAEVHDDTGGPAQEILEDCAIWPVEPEGAGASDGPGLNIWSDVCHPGRNAAALTLAGVLDRRGLRCGTVCPARPGDPAAMDLTWLAVPLGEAASLPALADTFIGWLLDQHRRPIRDLVAIGHHGCR